MTHCERKGGIRVCDELAKQLRGAVEIVLTRSGKLSNEPNVVKGFKLLAKHDQEYHEKYDPQFLCNHGAKD